VDEAVGVSMMAFQWFLPLDSCGLSATETFLKIMKSAIRAIILRALIHNIYFSEHILIIYETLSKKADGQTKALDILGLFFPKQILFPSE
jgi:hypothetical protein